MSDYPRQSTFLIPILLVLFVVFRDSVVLLFDADHDASPRSATLETRRNLGVGLLSQFNDPKAVLQKHGETATDFIFLVAIEGSGHHMNMALFAKSPAMKRFLKLKIRPQVRELLLSLYDNQDKSHGLWSAPTAKDDPNGADVVETLAEKLRVVDAAIRSASFPTPTMIPLNAGGIAYGNTGMMSYPNFHGRDRLLQYPDLRALYHACDLAEVSCRHVVLTRDPYAVIRSTTVNREFSTTRVAIQTYTTMLDVILAQMMMNQNRLAACWDFGATPEEELGALMGWRGDKEMAKFRKIYSSVFRGDGESMDEAERLEIVPQELKVYMTSMEMATERIQATCREILQLQRDNDPIPR